MPRFRLEYLFSLYLQQKISAEENEELMQLIADIGNEDEVLDIIDNTVHKMDASAELTLPSADTILHNILESAPPAPRVVKPFLKWWLSIAAGLLAVAGMWFLWKSSGALVEKNKNEQTVQTPIKPGCSKAFLTRNDGSVLAVNGSVGTSFGEEDECELIQNQTTPLTAQPNYNVAGVSGYNTLTTPRGGRFKVLLPDGSKVWLNAASSIRYPVVFGNQQRVVELTGEAFFKVKHVSHSDKKTRVPFIVNVKSSSGDSATVKVLGTSFNVSAYDNQKMVEVTLKQGSVRVEKGSSVQLLKPGEQAQVFSDNHISMIKNADVEGVTSWKAGVFYFENQDINTIMNEIGRWYDVTVKYEGPISTARFNGKISRDAEIDEVLEILKLSGVQFSIHNKTIVVK